MQRSGTKTLVVAGHGMVGHKLVEELLERDVSGEWEIVVFCEERRLAYDRGPLSSFFEAPSAEDLSLVAPSLLALPRLHIHAGDPVATIDRGARTVTSTSGRTVAYDALV